MNATLMLRAVPAAMLALSCSFPSHSQTTDSDMSFFVTSSNPGQGADFGGLDGADKHCQILAEAAGVKKRTWRAYLSTQSENGVEAVNAKDRIGKGPWRNAKGEIIANDAADLHSDSNKLSKETALTERGDVVNGRGDNPNKHDILTGTQADGTAFPSGQDLTCKNWTSSGAGAAQVGHHDRMGLKDDAPSRSWNSSHPSRGCSLDDLAKSGGAGLLYCFASD